MPPRGLVERGGISRHRDYSGQGPGGSTEGMLRFRWPPGLGLRQIGRCMVSRVWAGNSTWA